MNPWKFPPTGTIGGRPGLLCSRILISTPCSAFPFSCCPVPPLGDQSACGGALVPPGRRKNTNLLVVPRKTVDAGFDENHAELGVLVLTLLDHISKSQPDP